MSPLSTSSSGSAVSSQRSSSSEADDAALHGDAEQQPVDPGPPGSLGEAVESPGGAVCSVQSPAGVGAHGPVAQLLEVVIGEREERADRWFAGEVEQLGRRSPARGEVEQLSQQDEQRVGLAQRPVGEPHPQPRGRMGAGLVAHAEARGDERRERLDVRAHDQDVARL